MAPRLDPILIAGAVAMAWVALVISVLAGTLTETESRTVAAMAAGVPPAREASGGPDPEAEPIAVTIAPGGGVDSITTLLVDRGVLESEERFRTLLLLTGVGTELRADSYQFAPNTPAAEVIRQLRAGVARERFFVVHEGLRVEEVGEAVVTLGLATREEWEEAVALPRDESVLSALPRGATYVREGIVEGRIAEAPSGDTGFGYDPIFELTDGRAMAQLGDEKHTISHRGRAAREIIDLLKELP